MAQFDVLVVRNTGEKVVDCQSDLLRHLPTRVVIPLFDPDDTLAPSSRLNPKFTVEGKQLILAPQFLVSIPVAELTLSGFSLSAHDFAIIDALDTLVSGV